MVIISASILSKTEALIARQFIEISRLRIEGLLSAFLRLVEAGDKDHTYVESDSVRYVYFPIESLYLVLITNKSSNILEDIDTLKLLQQVVQSCCDSSVSEDSVLTKAFDIVFAFDEVISFGYRENVTLSQIKVYTEMESHDEKLSMLVIQEKMKEERKRGQVIASRLDKERKERLKLEQAMAHNKPTILTSALTVTEPEVSIRKPDLFTPTIQPISETYSSSSPLPFSGKGMELGKKKSPTAELLGIFKNAQP